jgi:hypothetical protein
LKKIFFVTVFLYAAVIPAQRITICKAYTNHGEPIDLIYSSNLSLNQSVCILFSGENKKIFGKTLYLFIDRITGNERENQLNKILKPEKENWVAQFYKFTKEGKFEIYFADENKNRISASTVFIGSETETKKTEPLIPQKYNSVEVSLCEGIQFGKPFKIKSSVSISKDDGTIYVCLNSDQPLGTEKILLNIWRKAKYGSDYDEFTDSKKYQLDRAWNDTYFKYSFMRPGDYRIYLYDEKELLIKTAYISVTN